MPRDGAMPLQVSQVPPEAVDLVWPHVLPMAERGLRHAAGDTTTAEHIRRDILTGQNLLWVVTEGEDVLAAIVLAVTRHPASTALTVVLIAGRDFARWAPLVQPLLEDFRALVGASTIESISRPGMERWMTALGWRKRAVVMEWREKD